MTTQKNSAPLADEDVAFPPRMQQVIDIIADSIAESIRAGQGGNGEVAPVKRDPADAEEVRHVRDRHANPAL